MLLNASRIKINGTYTDEYGIKPKGRYEVPTAEEDVEYIDIRGRDGELTKKYGYKNIPLDVIFTLHNEGGAFKSAFRKVKHHLLNAKTFQVDDDDEVYYKVKSVQINEAENDFLSFGEFIVSFVFAPFAYSVSNDPITITSATTINNAGYKAMPRIKATVAGTGKIYVGNQEVTVKDVNGTITIDSEMQNTYRAGSPLINMNKHMIGAFPVLETGNNTVSFDGDISKLEIISNKRWI